MSKKLIEISINNHICRTCSQTNDLVSIHQNTYLIGMLSTVTHIQIQLNDELPKMICLNCVKDLNKSYSFISKCKATDAALRQRLSKQKMIHSKVIKEESIKPKMTEEIFIKNEITDLDEYNDPLSDEWTKDPLEHQENQQSKEEFENKTGEEEDRLSDCQYIKEEETPKRKRKRSASSDLTKTAINTSKNEPHKQAKSTSETCKKPAAENAKNSRRKRTKSEQPASPKSAKENAENTANCPQMHEPLVLLKIERHARID